MRAVGGEEVEVMTAERVKGGERLRRLDGFEDRKCSCLNAILSLLSISPVFLKTTLPGPKRSILRHSSDFSNSLVLKDIGEQLLDFSLRRLMLPHGS